MRDNYIGVFDSGIGGTTILRELLKYLPYENYIYYADCKNNPYGNKSDKVLMKIVINIVNYFIRRKVKLIVIACNTATTRCIDMLRKLYPSMLFIGVEPAVKVACDKGYKNILVMATEGTIKSFKLLKLIDNNRKDGENIYLVPCEGLAFAIEKKDNIAINNILHNVLDKYVNYNIDAIVLGCTHYPLISNKIIEIMPLVQLIDGNIGVVEQVKKVLRENNLLNISQNRGKIEFITTY